MSIYDFILPVLGFVTTILSSIEIYRKGDAKSVFLLVIGIVVMGYSIIDSIRKNNADAENDNKLSTIGHQNDTLKIKLEKASKDRLVDSTNRAIFEKYLIDSFGIQRIGNMPVVDIHNNTTNFYTSLPGNPAMPDSINFAFRYSIHRDTIFVYPRIGSWVKPFLAFDTSFRQKNEGRLYQPDGMGTDTPDRIRARNKLYIVESIFMGTSRSKQRPMILDVKGVKNQPVFFGDDSDPQKRYLYENGNFYWVPNIDLTKD